MHNRRKSGSGDPQLSKKPTSLSWRNRTVGGALSPSKHEKTYDTNNDT